MKEIIIDSNNHGKHIILVDDEDFKYLCQWKWYILKIGKTFYARRSKDKALMHRLIMCLEDKRMVDHADKNGCNNQRFNLRFATKSQNAANSDFNKNNLSSKYRGVYKLKTCKRWEAYIHINNGKKNLGLFKSEVEAALAYNDAAIEYFGEFANINKITA